MEIDPFPEKTSLEKLLALIAETFSRKSQVDGQPGGAAREALRDQILSSEAKPPVNRTGTSNQDTE